ncbi:MAG: hypothetical protein EA393_06875 [Bacteroidetes bacterium]|nr:MAG: hypothetical protein EA393_06875 [Bacteroidota bacterium]
MIRKFTIPIILLSFLLSGCRTYYQRQQEFSQLFRTGQIQEAADVLERDRRGAKRRTRLLHLMNMGVVHHMLGNYTQSNEFFEEAFILSEDQLRNPLDEALALFSNPNMTEYRGEDFEILMIHYYKAMNFIQLGNFEAALVECRRLNNRLSVLADRFPSDNRYKRDAFIHNLMGVIYEAAGDHNNAFIAYRNAYNIYQDDFSRLFGLGAPAQLKKDLLRSANRMGFRDQVEFYEREFGFSAPATMQPGHGELVFFLQNGLGPVKHEWSVNFTIVRGSGGRVDFVNEELGLSFPFYLGASGQSSGDLGDLRIVRVAFPKYLERKPLFTGANVRVQGKVQRLEKAQDINAIAFRSLEDRMLREMGNALLRLAIRQATEQVVRRENQNVGAILGILGAVAERADTRNWQTLPHSIHYTRISLPEGNHNLALEMLLPNNHTGRTVNLETQIRTGRTSFINYHVLDSRQPGAR